MRDAPGNPDEELVLACEDRVFRVELSQRLFAALHSASRRAVSEGHASAALISAGIRSPALVDHYAAGYLLPQHRGALRQEEAGVLGVCDPFGCLLLPAGAPDSAPTELCCFRLDAPTPALVGTLALAGHRPALLAPRLAQVAGDLVITDRLDELIRRFNAGQQQVLLLRHDLSCTYQVGLIGAISRDHRITIASGLRSDDIRAACVEHGLTLAGSAKAPWILASFDRQYHRAIFRADGVEVTIDTPFHARDLLDVVVRVGDRRPYRDPIDLRSPAMRSTYCELVATKTGCDATLLGDLLDDGIIERLERIESTGGAAEPAGVVVTPYPTTVAFPTPVRGISDPIAEFATDMDRMGWCGDRRTKTLCLLALAGSRLHHPPWLVLRGPADATLPITGLLAHLMPEEDLILPSRTSRSLMTGDEADALRHRCVLVDDARILRDELREQLRMLAARGSISIARPVRETATGRTRSRLREIDGPVGVIAGSVVPTSIDELALVAEVDTSAEQAALAVAYEQRVARGDDLSTWEREAILTKWGTLLSALPRVSVAIPGAERISFPVATPRQRTELRLLLRFAAAAALLRHCDRSRDDCRLLATDDDLRLAIDATRGLIGQPHRGLSDLARTLWGDLAQAQEKTATRPQLAALHPRVSPWCIRHALDELVHVDVAQRCGGGGGRSAHSYRLVGDAPSVMHEVRLRVVEGNDTARKADADPHRTGTYG